MVAFACAAYKICCRLPPPVSPSPRCTAHTCIANVQYEVELSMQRTFFFFTPPIFSLQMQMFSTKFFMHISIYVCQLAAQRRLPEQQEITAAIQFINCKWKLNMQRNSFLPSSLSIWFASGTFCCCCCSAWYMFERMYRCNDGGPCGLKSNTRKEREEGN